MIHQCSGGSDDSRTATITVASNCVEPAITKQPQHTSIAQGEPAMLSVDASGTSLEYAWYEGESGDTSKHVGSDDDSLTVSPSVTTRYRVRVSNSCGDKDSDTATVFVDCDPPTITAQPEDMQVPRGGSILLSVTAPSASSYQWYRDGEPIDAATTAEMDTGSILVTTIFYVVVTNECGSTESRRIEVRPINRRRAVRRTS